MKNIRLKPCLMALAGSVIVAFGLYHVHSMSQVTEGGGLGLNLLLEHWLGLSPALTSFVFNAVCYFLGWRLLGREFIAHSAVATVGFSLTYAVLEQFDPLWPELAEMPLAAALAGAVFVGVGTGLCVRIGGAICGDDALAMCLSRVLRIKVQWAYLISDFTVLALSASYIPLGRLAYSLLTVVLSGQIIGWMQKSGGANA